MTTKTSKKTTKNTSSDTFKVNGEDLLKKVKEIIHEGNVRQITIETKEGKPIVVIPLTIGVVGVLLAPALAAVGAVAALVTDCQIKVEREK